MIRDDLAKILYPTYLKRFLFFFLFDAFIIIISLYISFLLRFDFVLSADENILVLNALPLFIGIKLITFVFFNFYRIIWRYVGIGELWNIVKALIVSELILVLVIKVLIPVPAFLGFLLLPDVSGFPRSIFIIDGIVSLLLISSLRISKRMALKFIRESKYKRRGKKTIILGAGHTGEMIIRDMARRGYSEFYPVGIIDNDRNKSGTYMHGVKVLGTVDNLKSIAVKYGADVFIIALPSLNYKDLRKIYDLAKGAELDTVKIVPRIYDFNKPDINVKDLEEIRIEDLIGRQSVDVDYGEIKDMLKGGVILVTGAGGSIGSEITMQVCGFHPEKVVLVDNDETELHAMDLKLEKIFPRLKDKIYFIAGDIRDEERMREVFGKYRPHTVFHSAAYKHVPMMEHNPQEAVKVNVFGTDIVARVSVDYGVGRFILISTDKAVRPTSVMGAAKRMAEYICKAYNGNGKTRFISVRFGNVLGSRGSVLPLFLDQLKHGGPLTVTHKDMKRYFMTIPEAVSLVLQASVIGNGGEVLVLDMGEPVRIVDMAEELIRLQGLTPYKDIDIIFTGLRPGEKLFEEILTAEEGTTASKHEKVFIARDGGNYSVEEIKLILKEFEYQLKSSSSGDGQEIRRLLRKYVRHFTEFCPS